MLGLDQYHHVVDGLGQRGRDQVERVADQLLEAVRGHPDGH